MIGPLGPKLMHSHRAGARPCAWPRASASPPELPRSASNWHLPHHSAPRAVQHLSSTARCRSTLDCTPLFGAALVHACLCSSLHRCTPRTAPLISMRSAAAWRSAPRLIGVAPTVHMGAVDRRTQRIARYRLRPGALLPERPRFCSAAQAMVRLQRSRGWRSSAPARQDVRSA